MSETEFQAPTGTFELRRPHTPASSPLRAWSAADRLVLEEIGSRPLGRLLVVNDEFGALTVALAPHEPTVWTDSALSRRAIKDNLAANGLGELPSEQILAGHQVPVGLFDTVIVRIPKTTALLDLQLRAISRCVHAESVIVGTGMVRHIHTSTLELFETHVGATTTSLAKRKARLIHVQLDDGVPLQQLNPTPEDLASSFTTPGGVEVVELPGTFCAGHLDIGSALLLDVLASVSSPGADATVLDLGCGNGVLAATLASQWAEPRFELRDVSDLAVQAAMLTMERNDLVDRASVVASDGCDDIADDSIAVVVTNPPFHQGHALDRALTDRLLADTARVLRPDGVAYVVVQRHLNLHASISRWFSSVDVMSQHPSHVVLKASPEP